MSSKYNSEKSFLTSLPREIRDEIYRYLVVKETKLYDLLPEKHLDFLLANKQIYEEALCVFYKDNLFSIDYLDIYRVRKLDNQLYEILLSRPKKTLKLDRHYTGSQLEVFKDVVWGLNFRHTLQVSNLLLTWYP